jgi:hypothetical protein
MPSPLVEAEARHADEGRSPAEEEHPASPDLPAAPTPGSLPPPGSEGLSLAGVAPTRNALSLEDRVRRLEDVVATLQLSPHAIQAAPGELTPPPHDQPSLADFIASAAQHLPSQPESAPPADPGMPASERTQRWLPFELLAEMRVMVRMYLDPRYRLTWQTRVLPPLVLFGMFLSWLLISGIPVVGFLFDRVFFLVLAYMLFKVLIREATRYRMTSPDLPPSLRL